MERNVNCLNTRAVIEYTRPNYPELMDSLLNDIDPFFTSIKNVEEFLCDEYNWVSQKVCAKLFERVRVHSGQKDIARYIGRDTVISRRFGYIENVLIKAIGNPYLSILRAPSINAKLNKTKTVEIVEADKTHAIIRLKWFKNLGSSKDICLYNQGIYEAMPTIWGLSLAKTEELKCFFEGDEYCELSFEWAHKSIYNIFTNIAFHRREMVRDSIAEIEREKAHLSSKYLEVENLNQELRERIERLTSLDACSKATTSILDTDKLLDVVMLLIVNVMHFDRALLMLVDEEQKKLRLVKGVGESEDEMKKIIGYEIPLDRTTNILARVMDSGITQVITDVDNSFLRKENIILKNFNPKSFIALPLITRNRVMGVLAAERFKGFEDFTSSDQDYMMNFCNQIAISLENARLIDSMKHSFVSSILSLASALEAKDPYTHGHSNRVAAYSTLIAEKLGFDEERVESIRLMALMHDVGKIGIPDSIIHKPGKLTEDEFREIKLHPIYSISIIEPLLENNPEFKLVKSHHERYDGKGYPDGLMGKNIPLEARIIAVSDCYDAMTSDRPYRSAMKREDALNQIKVNMGTQLCPEISTVFIDIISSMSDKMYLTIKNSKDNSPDFDENEFFLDVKND